MDPRQASDNELKARISDLVQEADALAKFLSEKSNPAVKAFLARKRKHLDEIRNAYRRIDVTDYPNVVVAKLAGAIGQEMIVMDDIALFDEVENKKKLVDREIKACHDEVEHRQKERSVERS
jgi:hypothetical protein